MFYYWFSFYQCLVGRHFASWKSVCFDCRLGSQLPKLMSDMSLHAKHVVACGWHGCVVGRLYSLVFVNWNRVCILEIGRIDRRISPLFHVRGHWINIASVVTDSLAMWWVHDRCSRIISPSKYIVDPVCQEVAWQPVTWRSKSWLDFRSCWRSRQSRWGRWDSCARVSRNGTWWWKGIMLAFRLLVQLLPRLTAWGSNLSTQPSLAKRSFPRTGERK